MKSVDSPWASIYYGPLLFAVPIPDENSNQEAADAHYQYALDLAAGEASRIRVVRQPMPAKWNWPLAAPLQLSVRMREFDWHPAETEPIPKRPVEGGKPVQVSLVPYGCTKFRVSVLPVTEHAWDGHDAHDREWPTVHPPGDLRRLHAGLQQCRQTGTYVNLGTARSVTVSSFRSNHRHAFHRSACQLCQRRHVVPATGRAPLRYNLISATRIYRRSLMDRRRFVQTVAGTSALAQVGALAQPSAPRTHIYRLDYFYYRQGDQVNRLNQFFTSQTPLFTKHMRVFGVFTAVMAPHAQTMMVLSGFARAEDMAAAAAAIEGDPGYRQAHTEFEMGPQAPFDSAQRVLLLATPFSPEIVPPTEKPKSPRYFELRIYHSPTQRQLALLHERFAGPEIQIFHRSGVHPILYADTIIGPDLPNLTYVIPFASLADREKAWDAFGADPDWARVRTESIARGGEIVNYNNISLWRATAYSPIQ